MTVYSLIASFTTWHADHASLLHVRVARRTLHHAGLFYHACDVSHPPLQASGLPSGSLLLNRRTHVFLERL